MKIKPSEKIYVADSKMPAAERGVFAAADLKKGDLIEICPIIEIPETQVKLLRKTDLINYYFRVGMYNERVAIALGYGSLYNHSYSPNADFETNLEERIIQFIALKNINKDEEITIDYNFFKPSEKAHQWIKKLKR